MSRGPHTFKQTDLTRALNGTRAPGIDVARIDISTDGKIVLVVRTADEPVDEKAGTEHTLVVDGAKGWDNL